MEIGRSSIRPDNISVREQKEPYNRQAKCDSSHFYFFVKKPKIIRDESRTKILLLLQNDDYKIDVYQLRMSSIE